MFKINEKYFPTSFVFIWSRDSSVGIGIGYGLDDRGVRVRVLVGSKEFSFLHVVQTGSGAHLVFYPMDNGGYLLGGEAAGA
jgi:hypothetical protein